jgi:hypothetical protein
LQHNRRLQLEILISFYHFTIIKLILAQVSSNNA